MKSTLWAIAIAVSAFAAQAQNTVVVFEDRFNPPISMKADEAPPKGASAVWEWSADTPPTRRELKAVAKASKAKAWLEVKVHPSPAKEKMTLLAGPADMWMEIPERLLPAFVIETSTKPVIVKIPIDPTAIWRVRLVAASGGSWWRSVPLGRKSVSLAPSPAVDRVIEIDDEQKKPVANIRVSLLDSNGDRGDYEKLSDYRTDRDGRIVVPAFPDAQRLMFFMSGDGWAPFAMESMPSGIPKRLTIKRGFVVSGGLADRDGRPIQGAKVSLTTFASPLVPVPLVRTAESDAEGKWEVSALPAGRGELLIEADGFGPETQATNLTFANLHLDRITLNPVATADVVVTDDAGKPVAGASINIGARRAAVTDAKGIAHVPLATDSSADIRVVATHHLTKTASIAMPLRRPASVVLQRAFRVRGRLVDAHGVPAPSGHVLTRQERHVQNVPLEVDGTFDLDLEPGGDWVLELSSPHAAVAKVNVSQGVAGELRELGDVASPAGRAVTGRLIRGDGSPIAGARVWFPRPSERGAIMAWAFSDILETVSEPNGDFVLGGIPDTPFTLRIEAASLAPVRRAVTPPTDASDAALGEVRLAGGTTLNIVIDGEVEDDLQARVDLGGQSLPMDQMTATFIEGRATLPNVPAGKLAVSAWHERTMRCREEVVVPADKSEMDVICTSRRVAVTGRVEVGGHAMGPGAVVFTTPTKSDIPSGIMTYGSGAATQQQVFSPLSERRSTDVGADGTFRADISPGPWQVWWMPEQGQVVGPKAVTVPVAAAYDLVLQYPGLSVKGVVLDGERKPVKEAQVRDLGGRGVAITRPDGSFTLAGPGAGTWKLQAQYRDQSSSVVTREVEEGRDAPFVELVLDAAAREIHVQAAPGAIVFLETPQGGLDLATADSTGTAAFRLREPAPVSVRAAASTGGIWALSDWTPLDVARKNGITLTFGATGSVVVHNQATSGAVTITRSDGWRIDRLLQWLGTFVTLNEGSDLAITGLPIGNYTLVLGEQQRSVSVAERQTAQATFEK